MRSGLKEAENGDASIYAGGIDGDQLAYALARTPETSPRTDNWAYQNAGLHASCRNIRGVYGTKRPLISLT